MTCHLDHKLEIVPAVDVNGVSVELLNPCNFIYHFRVFPSMSRRLRRPASLELKATPRAVSRVVGHHDLRFVCLAHGWPQPCLPGMDSTG